MVNMDNAPGTIYLSPKLQKKFDHELACDCREPSRSNIAFGQHTETCSPSTVITKDREEQSNFSSPTDQWGADSGMGLDRILQTQL